ncbi:hypothetical protein SAMN04489732_125108 [Amycolatopsis saalfeldensis]|uniref:Uncharacterized protein n=2 Tax=Amycolatopsis saalfeldensis TaxID=394193 RepID=A0A1H8YM62_9PSEU|nr:hypothetical protein [Amycolatopsis saalfeldensis]SEP53270.1 hypothetical protein SAMN04489732_125108 [Amycolatopsis saalfeldensis]
MVRPGFRERVEALMRDQWREPVIAVRLQEDGLSFEVPGRRQDGTVKGKRLVRRFFWNILRGIGIGVAYVLYLANGAGSGGGKSGSASGRAVAVTGPADAMALGLLDGIRAADGPWLVFSPSHVALVDTGSTQREPKDAPPPEILWQARIPQELEVNLRRRKLAWPDGSVFAFPLHNRGEEQHLRGYVEAPDIVHWDGRPE